ncbi:TonB-dependent receptor family protein [Flagellimonas sp.]|uniref:TonB-dependent receptor family protein n=1 Tax=Flagellimonas sp. TaxID=2058762 RepID=UPI003BB0F7E7
MCKPICLVGFYYIFFAVSLSAQNQQKDSITSLEEVILTEQEIEKKALGITPANRIGLSDIQRHSPLDVVSTINQIPGVYLLSGALNTNRITIRGVGARTPFGTDKLRLYFNNIPVTNGTGFSTIEAYDLENIGGIEVIKGPKGTAFGTNLGGAIILNTKPPHVGRTFLDNSTTFGSYHMFKNNLSFRHSEKKFDLSLSYNHLKTEGYRQNNTFERDGLLLTSSVGLGDHDEIGFLFNHIDYTAQIPSSLGLDEFKSNPTNAAANWLAAKGFESNAYTLAGITYSHVFQGGAKNSTSIFYSYLDHYEPRPFNILDEFTNGFGLRSIFKGRLFGESFTLGGELYRDEYHWGTFDNLYEQNQGMGSLKGDRLSSNLEFRGQWNIFGSIAFDLTDQLVGQFGLNLNKTTYDFRDLFHIGSENTSAKRSFDPILTPNLQVQYQLKNGSLYLGLSRGFSNPGLEETLTPDGVINPDIAQEKGINYELGGTIWLLGRTMSVKAALYHMQIKDLLVAQRIGEDQYIGKNAGRTRHQGMDLDASYTFTLSSTLAVKPFVAYTFSDHKFVEFISGDNDYGGNPLTGVPKHRISSGLDIVHPKSLALRVSYQYVDDIPLTDSNSLSSEAYHVFNVSTNYSIDFSDHFQLVLNYGLNNLFDAKYAGSVLINAVGFGGRQPRYFYPANRFNHYGRIGLTYSF